MQLDLNSLTCHTANSDSYWRYFISTVGPQHLQSEWL